MFECYCRCDLNVSVRKASDGSSTTSSSPAGAGDVDFLSERVEIKNLNSVRNIVLAAENEAQRQIAVYEAEDGSTVEKESRHFDGITGETLRMRDKESSHDYRFLPEPDIPPILITEEMISSFRSCLPELPDEVS